MIIGICTYIIYTGCQLLALLYYANPDNETWKSMYGLIYGLNLTFAVVNGWGNALLFVCASSYVNEAANDKNKGLFNSLLWIFNTGSFISGNLVAAFVIPYVSQVVYFYFCIGMLIITAFFFLILKNPLPQPDHNDDDSIDDE